MWTIRSSFCFGGSNPACEYNDGYHDMVPLFLSLDRYPIFLSTSTFWSLYLSVSLSVQPCPQIKAVPEAPPVLPICQSVYLALAPTPNPLSKEHCSTGLETGCKPVLFPYLFSYLSLPLSLPHVRPFSDN